MRGKRRDGSGERAVNGWHGEKEEVCKYHAAKYSHPMTSARILTACDMV
jgi:hypothetical protein